MAVVDVDGVSVGYDLRGTGPPLVLLHGGGCDRRVWRPELDDLSDAFTVVAWDAPGCGGSSDPPEQAGLSDYADVLRGVLAALGLSRPHLVGHSWGAGLALQLAVDHPEVPASLVLVGGYAGWAGSLPADEVRRRLAFALDAADRLPGGFDPHSMPGLFSERIPPDRATELAAVMADARPVGTRVMARAFADADLSGQLHGVEAPTLLLHGTADARSPRAVAEALHTALPRSTLVLVPGAGHELVLEVPDVFRAAVRAFVGALQTGSPGR